jgi:glycosyltransferase involved in cell wall biosynthesis
MPLATATETDVSIAQALTAPNLDSVFWPPTRIGVESAWWGHVPFAHWLVTQIRPRVIVELGTHRGVSFAGFCEGVLRNNLNGRCYAVDTWQGDEHAGLYGDEIYQDLRDFILSRYGAFAAMLRCTFDEAVSRFSDGEIDLLHIDGLHTYEAVRHDFETWLPKLSRRGVILFHDTNVHERGFGVWKFWEEVRDRYPHFEFLHSHGLGVLAVGPEPAEALLELCQFPPPARDAFRERLGQIGDRWTVVGWPARAIADHQKHAANLQAELEIARSKIADYQKHAANLQAESENARSELEAMQAQVADHRKSVKDAERELRRIRADHEEQLGVQAAAFMQHAEEHRRRALADQATQIYASTSWRVTAPLRAMRTSRIAAPLKASVRRLRGLLRNRRVAALARQIIGFNSADAILITNSGFFDEAFYAGASEARAMNISPVDHYVRIGEAAGLAPSARFDLAFYKRQRPDLVGLGLNYLAHYLRNGCDEGYRATSAFRNLDYPTDRIKPDRPTVLVAVHEASRTGGSILAWNIVSELESRYNVVVLLKRDGPLRQAFGETASALVELPLDIFKDGLDANSLAFNLTEGEVLASELKRRYGPLYLIANTAETRQFVPAFERAGIPVLALIHEFSSYVRPEGALDQLFRTASKIVFSAQLVADAALADYGSLEARTFDILPQGACRLPPVEAAHNAAENYDWLPADDGSILVIGMGTVNVRKGVEFFIAAAASVQDRHPSRRVRFAWIGKPYPHDQAHMAYLEEQVKRSGLNDSFVFAGEFADLDPIYRRADICFLSSRLDPLPNTSIDAAVHGIPVICFDQASGIADILKGSEATRSLVAPHLNAEAAASRILALVENPDDLKAASKAMRDMAAVHFDMSRYVETLDRLGREAIEANGQAQADHRLIEESGVFEPRLFLGEAADDAETGDPLQQYLHASQVVAPRARPRTGVILRRPMAGFHPMIYAEDCAEYDEASGEDPLAHYVRQGRPEGRWKHRLIEFDGVVPAQTPLKVAIHGHFHYPEQLADFVSRLRRNRTKADLLLTTTSQDRANTLETLLSRLGIKQASVTVSPNRGRDIGPMLTGLPAEELDRYDVIGHFHSKKSPHVDSAVGDAWRNFMWEHLMGGDAPMMDVVLKAFHDDPALGLVFAEDPHLNDWDWNRKIADEMAEALQFPRPLPNHFDFPVGTTFWIRPRALAPLRALALDWNDYPPEPLPIDGTLLHTLERLLPFSAAKAGFGFATTHCPAWTR